MNLLLLFAVFLTTFLIGSVPFGIVIGKLFYNRDIRETGSGNIGTTNAIRALGKVGGYAVFILDFGKGVLSGFVALAFWSLASGNAAPSAFPSREDFLALSFLGCVMGHVFCPWLGFKGGKGIAVAIGCMFVAYGPVISFAELGLFAILVVVTRYVSVGSIAAALLCVVISPFVFAGHPFAMVAGSLTGALITWAHRANIVRLAKGEENRIGSSKRN